MAIALNNLARRLRMTLRWLVFPGLNLHARLRYRRIPEYLASGSDGDGRTVLDAGSGNGMLSYKSYLRGNDVTGISLKPGEVRSATELFNGYLGIPEERLQFKVGNLYDLEYPDSCFDEIICAEVLEHLKDDRKVCESFWRILKPGGVLHVCAPNAHHPYNKAFPLDREESGGHVRPGYTMESYRALLEPIGFSIVESRGLGGPVRQLFNARIKHVQELHGPIAGVPLFMLALLILPLESASRERRMPFSIYAKAMKCD